MVGNANANGIPFLKRYGISPAIKNSMVLWYDIARQGATNESMAENPILKDLSGNGHDITCYNFAWSGMSGIGGYKVNFNEFRVTNNSSVKEHTYNKLVVYNTEDVNTNFWDSFSNLAPGETYHVDSYKVRISGLSDEETIIYIYYNLNDDNSTTPINIFLRNGIYTIPEINMTSITGIVDTYTTGFQYFLSNIRNKQITIELLPEYPNALVSDGVDDCCIVNGLPILTDYTVIAKRKWIKTKYDTFSTFSAKSDSITNGEFIFERFDINGNPQVYNFGAVSSVGTFAENITYQTTTSYNGKTINKGNLLGNGRLTLFGLRGAVQLSNIALYSFVIFNRTLTEDEIKKWIRINMDKDYLLPSERPKPNIYYDFRNGDNSNLTTVTDLSGNERHGTMYNFTGEADSGYSDGCLKFNGIDNYIQIPYSDDAVYKTVILLVRPSLSKGANIIYDGRYATGLTTGICLFYEGPEKKYLSSRLSDNAKVYVNGVINTSYTNADMNGKKNCVAVSDDVPYSGNLGGPPNIGTVRFASGWFAYMELYAFLGFDKILTEEEIKYVMNKYNLLEDIDELII